MKKEKKIKNLPVKKFGYVTVWKNEDGSYSYTVEKTFKREDSNEYEVTTTYFNNELFKLKGSVDAAFYWALAQENDA